jgi:hypothetical protein
MHHDSPLRFCCKLLLRIQGSDSLYDPLARYQFMTLFENKYKKVNSRHLRSAVDID